MQGLKTSKQMRSDSASQLPPLQKTMREAQGCIPAIKPPKNKATERKWKMKCSLNHGDIYGIFLSDRARRCSVGSFIPAPSRSGRRAGEEEPPVTRCSSLPDLIWPEVINPNGNVPETSSRIGPKLPSLLLLAGNN